MDQLLWRAVWGNVVSPQDAGRHRSVIGSEEVWVSSYGRGYGLAPMEGVWVSSYGEGHLEFIKERMEASAF